MSLFLYKDYLYLLKLFSQCLKLFRILVVLNGTNQIPYYDLFSHINLLSRKIKRYNLTDDICIKVSISDGINKTFGIVSVIELAFKNYLLSLLLVA